MNNQSTDAVSMPTPVTVTHQLNDVVEIEGVKYSGDFFRTFAMPDPDALYRFRRTSDGAVMVEKQSP